MLFSNLKTLWKGTQPVLVSLRTINVSYSKNLETTPDFSNLTLIEKLLFRGCKSLLKVHPSIGQLTNLSQLDFGECKQLKELPELVGQLGHLDLGGCVNMKRVPELIKNLTNLTNLKLGQCRYLKRLPEQLGDMKGLKMLDVSCTPIEQLPDSIVHLKELVELRLMFCMKLRKLPEQFGNMESLRIFSASDSAIEQLPDSFAGLINLVHLNLHNCSKIERLPEQLGKMQCLEDLNVYGTSVEEIPESIGLLSRLQALHFRECKKLKYVPKSIWNLRSLTKLILLQPNMVIIDFPDTVKNMKLEDLNLRCNIRLWLPVILSFSSLKSLTLVDQGQSFSSTKPFSLSMLSNLQRLSLENCTSLGSSFPELPLKLQHLLVFEYATLEQLPDLSSLKQLKQLVIERCNSLQSLLPLPPHLEELIVEDCTRLQDVPDLSMLKTLLILSFRRCSNLKSISLKQSSLQLGGQGFYSSFKADLPNREVAEWFSYKSSGRTLSFDIPSNSRDNFIGVALWVVYKLKSTGKGQHIRAVFTNVREGIKMNYNIPVLIGQVGEELQSRVECIWGNFLSVKSGDRIKVSFRRELYTHRGVKGQAAKVNVEKCGAHVISRFRFVSRLEL